MCCLGCGDMKRTAFWDAGDEGKEVQIVMVWKMRWRWWCESYGEGVAV